MTTRNLDERPNHDENGKFKPGNNANPTGKGGFQERPEDRVDGRWRKEDSFSYWLNKFKAMNHDEFFSWLNDVPESERTVAQDIAYARIRKAWDDLQEFKEVADRTEGRAPQTIIHEGGFFDENKVKIITDDTETNEDTETSEEDL